MALEFDRVKAENLSLKELLEINLGHGNIGRIVVDLVGESGKKYEMQLSDGTYSPSTLNKPELIIFSEDYHSGELKTLETYITSQGTGINYRKVEQRDDMPSSVIGRYEGISQVGTSPLAIMLDLLERVEHFEVNIREAHFRHVPYDVMKKIPIELEMKLQYSPRLEKVKIME